MKTPGAIALVAVTDKGVKNARLVRQRLKTGDVYRPTRYGPVAHSWEHLFDGPLGLGVQEWFERYSQIVFFLAVGAVTRLVAPCIKSKETDPGIVAVDEAGRFAVAVLSGHRGGANAFARTLAGCLGITPVITTASDVVGGLSLDMLEEMFGWTGHPACLIKDMAMAILNGEPVALLQDVGTRGAWLADMELPENLTPVSPTARLRDFRKAVWVTERTPEQALASCDLPIQGNAAPPEVLFYHPQSLVLGVGCERGLTLAGLEAGLRQFLNTNAYAMACIDTLASISIKADEPSIVELARQHGWHSAFYSADELSGVAGIATPSAMVDRCIGTPGVAEPAALLAAGAEQLLVPKQIVRVPGVSQAMTFALARHRHIEVKSVGHAKVYFVGAGPGDEQLLTLKALHLLRRAQTIIYAGSLIPESLLRHVPPDAQIHNSAFLTLDEIMEITLRAARAGRLVVRLHSGDTSIYSSIQEQISILEKEKIAFEVVPGISSYQALAAALKCEFTLPEKVQTVILTRGEGATPMPKKESLASLAQHGATLCIFLSARLASKIEAQLLTAYSPDTPVAIAYRISWPDEKIIVTRLDRLAAEMRHHDFQRTTLIAVGPAIGGRHLRSHLYDEKHGHIFRKRTRPEDGPSP